MKDNVLEYFGLPQDTIELNPPTEESFKKDIWYRLVFIKLSSNPLLNKDEFKTFWFPSNGIVSIVVIKKQMIELGYKLVSSYYFENGILSSESLGIGL